MPYMYECIANPCRLPWIQVGKVYEVVEGTTEDGINFVRLKDIPGMFPAYNFQMVPAIRQEENARANRAEGHTMSRPKDGMISHLMLWALTHMSEQNRIKTLALLTGHVCGRCGKLKGEKLPHPTYMCTEGFRF